MSPESYEHVARGIRLGAGVALMVYAVILALVMRTRSTAAWSRKKAIGALVGVATAASIYASSHALAKFFLRYYSG